MAAAVEVTNLKKYFDVPDGVLHAVDDVTFQIEAGTTIGIVGESGCGKSTLGRTLIHLEKPTGGRIVFEGEDVTYLRGKKLKKFREKIQFIFQDPYASLNPRKTIEETIREPLKISGRYNKQELRKEIEGLMELTGIEERLQMAYPHELDGGRRQRVGIARALALHPSFVICDEPVSALDVSIQAQILNLLMDIQEKNKLTMMFITHDLSVVEHISDSIAVMYLGQIVEKGSKTDLFEQPLHPYTKALLSAVPSIDIDRPSKREILRGEIQSPVNPMPGCRFRSRCKYACKACGEPQTLQEVKPDYFVACCRVKELNNLQASESANGN